MARNSSKTYRWVEAALIFGAVVLMAIAYAMWSSGLSEAAPTPTRATPMVQPSSSAIPLEATPTEATAIASPAPVIPEAPISRLSIPAIALDIAVSGETYPRETPNCKGAVTCIDPPLVDQAAWYGATPATPSAGTVRLFGHTSRTSSLEAAFDDIPAMQAGDEIVVTTEAGVFTYRATAPQLVPYTQVTQSQLIWGEDDDRLVLITCNNPEDAGTVVEAWLVEATEL